MNIYAPWFMVGTRLYTQPVTLKTNQHLTVFASSSSRMRVIYHTLKFRDNFSWDNRRR